MMILHDSIKTIQNMVFVLFFLRTKTSFISKNPKKPRLKKNRRVVLFKKSGFSQP